MPLIQAEDLHSFAVRLVTAMGGSSEESETVADVLVRSNLAGHDSHGAIRLEQYARMVREGQIVPGAPFEIVRQTPAATWESAAGALLAGRVAWRQSACAAATISAVWGITC